MKSAAILLMTLNHLLAPWFKLSQNSYFVGFGFLLSIFSGELARHLFVFAMMDKERFQSSGFINHAKKLSFKLLATIVAVIAISAWSGNWMLVQLPVSLLILNWLRLWAFRCPKKARAFGIALWIVGFSFIALKIPFSEFICGGGNLIGSALCFPAFRDSLSRMKLNSVAMPFVGVFYLFSSITGVIVGINGLDYFMIGLPLLLLAALMAEKLKERKWFLDSITKRSLRWYVGTLAICAWIPTLS